MHAVYRSQKWRQLMDSLGKTSCEDYRNVSPHNLHLLSCCPCCFSVLHTELKMRLPASAVVQAAAECERYLSGSELCVCVRVGRWFSGTHTSSATSGRSHLKKSWAALTSAADLPGCLPFSVYVSFLPLVWFDPRSNHVASS